MLGSIDWPRLWKQQIVQNKLYFVSTFVFFFFRILSLGRGVGCLCKLKKRFVILQSKCFKFILPCEDWQDLKKKVLHCLVLYSIKILILTMCQFRTKFEIEVGMKVSYASARNWSKLPFKLWEFWFHRFLVIFLLALFTRRHNIVFKYAHIALQFLPVYIPNEEEKKDANLFARNVRAVMAK